MFRQASLLVGAIVLIAGIHCRPSVCKAWDNVKPGPRKEMEAEKAEIVDPDKFDKFDLGDIEDTPPAELGFNPTLKSRLGGATVKPVTDWTQSTHHWLRQARGTRREHRARLAGQTTNSPMVVGACTITLSGAKTRPVPAKATFPAMPEQPPSGCCPFLAAGLTHKSKGCLKFLHAAVDPSAASIKPISP